LDLAERFSRAAAGYVRGRIAFDADILLGFGEARRLVQQGGVIVNGKKQDKIVGGCHYYILYYVLFPCLHSHYSPAAPALAAVGVQRHALDVV
jgi:hypothetical protein